MRPVRRETLPVLVANEIRNDIDKGTFKPGDKLPTENELCKILGVGRPTLREALRYLEGQQLIEFKYGEGSYVVDSIQLKKVRTTSLKREVILELLEYEIIQSEEEGKDVSAQIKKKAKVLMKDGSLEELERFYFELGSLKQRADFQYIEPTQIDEILKNASTDHSSSIKIPKDEILVDRLHGAWLGRCVGCIMGKPVEGWTKQQIESYLKTTGTYPLEDYFVFRSDKTQDSDQSFHPTLRESTRGHISFAARDDDLDYTILNLKVIKENGFKFTPEDIAEAWLSYLPFKKVYTAERQAYLNLVNEIEPPASATYRNPFREWIGAQIRADIFGYLAPGDAALAAQLAYKDASVSHLKNGIYGEMFIAALIAVAFINDDLEQMIRIGLSLIPEKSRLHEMIENVLTWSKEQKSWKDVWEMVNKEYGKYHWIHVLPNLAFVLIGLIWGGGDFRKTTTITVMCGSDTDCNGATVGSIIGAMKGKNAIPGTLINPLNDRIKSAVFGYSDTKISSLAQETVELVESIEQH